MVFRELESFFGNLKDDRKLWLVLSKRVIQILVVFCRHVEVESLYCVCISTRKRAPKNNEINYRVNLSWVGSQSKTPLRKELGKINKHKF